MGTASSSWDPAAWSTRWNSQGADAISHLWSLAGTLPFSPECWAEGYLSWPQDLDSFERGLIGAEISATLKLAIANNWGTWWRSDLCCIYFQVFSLTCSHCSLVLYSTLLYSNIWHAWGSSCFFSALFVLVTFTSAQVSVCTSVCIYSLHGCVFLHAICRMLTLNLCFPFSVEKKQRQSFCCDSWCCLWKLSKNTLFNLYAIILNLLCHSGLKKWLRIWLSLECSYEQESWSQKTGLYSADLVPSKHGLIC